MSVAPVEVPLVPCRKVMLSCTQSTTACTRCHPGGASPKSRHAVLPSLSDSQYRLARGKCRVEGGRAATAGWGADARTPGAEDESLARVPIHIGVLVEAGRRPRLDPGTAQREHRVGARFHLENEG